MSLVYIASKNIFMRSLMDYERQDMVQTLIQTSCAFDSQIENLAATCSNYSYWDDMYSFVHTRDVHFIKSSLARTSLDSLGLDAMIVYDDRGHVVYGSTGKKGSFSGTGLQ
jgi:sensor domain CHASE-containing protein